MARKEKVKPNRDDALKCLKPVDSSFIAKLGSINEESMAIVYVQMSKSGVVYAHEEVPIAIFEQSKDFKSIGTWYNSLIKGKYPAIPVDMTAPLAKLMGEGLESEVCNQCGCKLIEGKCPKC